MLILEINSLGAISALGVATTREYTNVSLQVAGEVWLLMILPHAEVEGIHFSFRAGRISDRPVFWRRRGPAESSAFKGSLSERPS
jgi:hypothetical protein